MLSSRSKPGSTGAVASKIRRQMIPGAVARPSFAWPRMPSTTIARDPSARLQLRRQRLRQGLDRALDDHRIERAMLPHALRQRPRLHYRVVDRVGREQRLRLRGHARVGLERHHRLGHARQHRGRIAEPAAEVEHQVRRPDVQRIEQLRKDPRIEQHPAGRQRHMLAEIGHRPQRLGQEFLPRHREHRLDDRIERHVGGPDLPVHHDFACGGVVGHAGGLLGGPVSGRDRTFPPVRQRAVVPALGDHVVDADRRRDMLLAHQAAAKRDARDQNGPKTRKSETRVDTGRRAG